MNDDDARKKPPIGSIRQYATLGGGSRKKFEEKTLPVETPETDTSVNTSKEPTTQTEEKSSSLAAPSPQTDTSTFTSDENPFAGRHYGAQAFDKTHKRVTLWMEKQQEKQFSALAHKQGRAKAALLYEAVSDVLKKYEENPNRH